MADSGQLVLGRDRATDQHHAVKVLSDGTVLVQGGGANDDLKVSVDAASLYDLINTVGLISQQLILLNARLEEALDTGIELKDVLSDG